MPTQPFGFLRRERYSQAAEGIAFSAKSSTKTIGLSLVVSGDSAVYHNAADPASRLPLAAVFCAHC